MEKHGRDVGREKIRESSDWFVMPAKTGIQQLILQVPHARERRKWDRLEFLVVGCAGFMIRPTLVYSAFNVFDDPR